MVVCTQNMLIGAVLVFLQFATIALLISTFWWIDYGTVLWPRVLGAILGAVGIAVLVAGVVAFHTVNTKPASVLPLPTEGASLVTSGVWGVVRHPMYCGLLHMALGLCCWHQHYAVFVVWGWFALLLACKATFEERLLLEAFPTSYPRYRSQVCMLFPLPCWRYHGDDTPPL
jgi:protein-S-isoprenylcysteine O-methyltransferase Ste14